MKNLSHTNKQGKAVMIDVGEKEIRKRTAKAAGHIRLATGTLKLIKENLIKKGDVLTVAQIAGINAAKQTQTLIPLCHNINLEYIRVELTVTNSGINAESEIKCTGKTGAEMEALTAVSLALLTVYDMCKAVDDTMVIDNLELIEKTKK
jgi:cyclic pyranopterin phosphate synthase